MVEVGFFCCFFIFAGHCDSSVAAFTIFYVTCKLKLCSSARLLAVGRAASFLCDEGGELD